jgi:hypothetical protein
LEAIWNAMRVGKFALIRPVGMGVEGQAALDEALDGLDLGVRDGLGPALHADEVDDAHSREDEEPVDGLEAGEAVAREERKLDPLAAVRPAAPAGPEGQEHLDPGPGQELLAHELLVSGARPDRVPGGARKRLDRRPGPGSRTRAGRITNQRLRRRSHPRVARRHRARRGKR